MEERNCGDYENAMSLRDDMRAKLTPEQKSAEEFIYEHTKFPQGVFVLGIMVSVAADHPDWDFWQVLRAAREKLVQ